MIHSNAYGVPGADKPLSAIFWLIAILVLMLLARLTIAWVLVRLHEFFIQKPPIW